MALSAAEKQRRYRQRRDQDQERRREHLLKQKQKYQDDIKTGKRKRIEDLSERAKRSMRKKWREEKKRLRSKKQIDLQVNTPPNSPGTNFQDIPGPSHRQTNPKDKRKIAKCFRELTAKKNKIKELEKKVEKYRSRWRRLGKSNQTGEDTPNKASEKILKKSKKTVRKVLVFHHALLSQMKSDSKLKKANKKVLASVLAGNIMRKYKIKTWAFKELGLDSRRTRSRKIKGTLSERLCKSVVTFLERDDNSRLTTGIKSTVTRKKVKKQKRLLLDTLMNLHQKYLSEQSSNLNISYSVFCRLRPFWVVMPTEKDRETCLCKLCENSKYLAEAMHKHKLTTTSNLELLCAKIVCSTDCKECMYRTCMLCKNKEIPVCSDDDGELSWFQWKTVKEQRVFKSGEKKEITLVKKHLESGNAAYLGSMMNIHLKALTKHIFNIKNQFKYYKTLKEQLVDSECLIHIDFAENYVGKMANEIQSVHFGASRPQITLHTGAYYVNGEDQEKEVTSFCTLSDCLEHGPSAIWTYLNPVLLHIKQNHPTVSFIHFFSDGPVTQYKQKKNFYLLSTEIFHMGFAGASWNFHESGHGKGVPDAIGGSLKRSADLLVRHGKDIMSAAQFKRELEKSGTYVLLYVIDPQSVFSAEGNLTKNTKQLKSVPNTMALHQIQTVHPGIVTYRNVSCVCRIKKECKGHEFTRFSFPVTNVKSTNDQILKVSMKQILEKVQTSKRKKQQKENKQEKKPRLQPQKSKTNTEGVSHDIYEKHLRQLQDCKSFSQLKRKCRNIHLSAIEGTRQTILENRLTVDQIALDMYPSDVPDAQVLFPVVVQADGDCLPASGSVFAFGSSERASEMRLRIAMELALHEECYLDNDYLCKGSKNNSDVRKAFAMYSETFIPGVALTENAIKTIFENEVRTIVKLKTFMGIWQMFALSSVLQMPIFSVYPRLGNTFVRDHLHRRIEPRVKSKDDMAVIMWSSTRSDMVQQHWVPNHFLPVLPIDCAHSVEQCQYSEVEKTGDVATDDVAIQVTYAVERVFVENAGQRVCAVEIFDEDTGIIETACEGTGVVETVDEGTGVVETVDEGTGIVETLGEGTGIIATAYEGTGVVETVGEGTGVVETVSEGTGIVETVGEGTGGVETVGEGTGVVETVGESTGIAETVGDCTGIVETVGDCTGIVETVGEGTGVVETVGDCTGIVETVGDCTGIDETVGDCTGIAETVGDCTGIVETVGEGTGIVKTVGDCTGIVETVGEGTGVVETVGDCTGIVETVGDCTGIAETVGDCTGIAETVGDCTGIAETVGDCTGIVETVGEGTGIVKTVGDCTGIVETVGEGTGVVDTGGEGTGISETDGEGTGIVETVGEGTDVVETVDEGTGIVETVGEGTVIVETVGEGTGVVETVDEGTGIVETVGEGTGVVETVSESTGIVETVSEDTCIFETVGEGTGIIFKDIWENIAVGKYVFVTYDNEIYPGIVLKICWAEKEVFVQCMNKEPGYDRAMFSWPRKKDRCWYPVEAVKALIPPPIKSGSLFHVATWELFCKNTP